mmetsp:Transcript_37743/g.94714  ORF Transcript_37743/g.94714 Transcript_37743/m.94714 type:complete len:271 (+) Transcript_37743:1271-2083(+)
MHARWMDIASTETLKPRPRATMTFCSSFSLTTVFTQAWFTNCLPTSASGIASLLMSNRFSVHPWLRPSFVTPSTSTSSPWMRSTEMARPRLLRGLKTLLPLASDLEVSAVITSRPDSMCRTIVGIWPCGWWPEIMHLMPELSRNLRTFSVRLTGLPLSKGLQYITVFFPAPGVPYSMRPAPPRVSLPSGPTRHCGLLSKFANSCRFHALSSCTHCRTFVYAMSCPGTCPADSSCRPPWTNNVSFSTSAIRPARRNSNIHGSLPLGSTESV